MATHRRLDQRFALASRAVHQHRLRRRPVLEVLEGRVVLSTFTVNSLGDAGSGSNDAGDLRYCINQANANDQANTIVFDSTVFSTPQTITLGGSALELSDTVGPQTITGPAAGVTINGGGKSGVFQVNFGVSATVSDLTITDGTDEIITIGGGVFNAGTATLVNCTLSGNSATIGGGVFNEGTATLINCTLIGNSAVNGGGVFNQGTATLTNCTLSGNSAFIGGGVYNIGTATLTDTIVAGNTGPSSAASDITGTVTGSHNLIGTGGSGGLTNGQGGNIVLTSLTGLGLAPLAFYGGPTQTMALLAGSAAIGQGVAVSGVTTDQRGFSLDSPIDIGAFQFHSSYTLVVKTTSDRGAPAGEFDLRGAVDLADVLTGAQTITFDPTVFATAQTIVLTAGPLELSQTSGLETITGPQAAVTISGGYQSGVFQVNRGVTASISGLTITDAHNKYSGGGVDNDGTVNLTNCTISGSFASHGGGVYNVGTATLNNCTFSGNSGGSGVGVDNSGTATLINCTISGNSGFSGGGVYNSGTATLTHCTLSGNYAFQFGGGVDNDGKATLTDTIVAGNIGPSSAASDIDGTVTGSHDLIGTGGSGGLTNGEGGNIVLTSLTGLGLAPLAFYGGPTQTMALLAGSAAIGQGTAVSGVSTDQRGFSLDSPIDIGAFQFYSSDSLVVKSTSDRGAPAGEFDLRGAVDLADVLTGARTITFDSTVFATAQTIVLTAGPLELSQTSGLETITGPQAGVTISGGGTSGVIHVNAGATASFSGLTITDGSNTSGAGMDNDGTVNLTNCTISGNSASHGGAVYNGGTGTATLTNCTLSGNYANDGGGVDNDGTATLINCTISGNSAFQYGGGVNNSGTATLINCTISGNSATFGGGVDNYGTATLTNCTISGNSAIIGGGVYNAGAFPFRRTGTATLINCTISGNSAGFDGGVGNVGSGTATLTHCTISGNSASNGSGGGVYNETNYGYTASLTDTIVAGNTGRSSAASDITGTVTGSHNLIGTGGSGGLISGQNGNIVLTSLTGLGLAPLAFYGGPTQTMALLAGSAAIGQGVAVSAVTTDQRGFSLDSPIDIGAFQTRPSTGKLVVNSTADGSGNQPGKLDLRGAIDLANVLTGAQTITFDPTVFAKAQTIVLTAGPLELSQTSGLETIQGSQAAVTISGGGTSGVFQVDRGVTASISGLTITDGSSTSGGGVDNSGTVNLTNCTISGNSASHGGGGVYDGGTGTATLTNCTLSGNSADDGGGVDNSGTATLIHCTISGNQASDGGGGVYNSGTATLTDTIVAGNIGPSSAPSDITGTITGTHNLIGTGGSGGLINGQNGNIVLASLTGLGLAPLAFYGGPTQTMALLAGSAAIGQGTAVSGVTTDQRGFSLDSPIDIGAFQTRPSTGSLVVNSTADGSGNQPGKLDLRGAIDLADVLAGAQTITFDPIVFANAQTIVLTAGPLVLSQTGGLETITGPQAAVTISGGGTSGVFQVDRGVTASISGLTITGGSSTSGGGVDNVGTVNLTNCTISGNSASAFGGGVDNDGTVNLTNCTISGNSASAFGGGVDNDGTVNLTNCTISGNSASAFGGGVNNSGTATLTNCTISRNAAQYGGGVDNIGTATLTNCTISGNQASDGGGGVDNVGTATLTNTIVAGNTGRSSAASDIDGTVTGSHNLIGTGGSGGLISGQNGNIVLTSLTGLGLAPLAFYGGPTQTMALLAGSTAIGQGTAVSGVTTDQRGFSLDSPIDIGAFQFHSSDSLVVETTSDRGAPAGEFDLRGAVDLADVLTGARTITFDPTVFATAQTIVLTAGPLVLSQTSGPETITGPQAGVTISGGYHSGVFQVDRGVTATLSGLTITDGISTNGGGVDNDGTATLTNCIVSGNSAKYAGGVDNDYFGTATLTNCTISGNSASFGGGMDNVGTATLTDCTISRNAAQYGGGVENIGTATLNNCTISGNSAPHAGGGMDIFGGATLTDCTIAGNTAFFGGGLYDGSGTTTLTGCTVSSNTAYTGGGTFNRSSNSMTVDGCTISGNTAYGATGSGGGIFNSASLSVSDSNFDANESDVYYGGGLENYQGTTTLTDCTFSGNTATYGGGASNFGGSLTANGCTLSGNVATNGGGVYNVGTGTATLTGCTISGNFASFGGGVQNIGTATIANCTLSGNSAFNGGGGVNNGGTGTATLTNCTLSGNSADFGGGVNIGANATTTLINCTLSGNSAQTAGGVENFGTATLTDTSVAGNTGPASAASDIAGTVTGSHNLIGTGGSGGLTNGQNGNIVLTSLTSLGLAPLGSYGGPTQTMALDSGSPALGAGIAVSGVTTDQRGVPRGKVLDIGAYQATATQLDVSGFPSPTAPGVSHSFTVNAVDPFGQPALDFNGPVTFSSSDPSATLPTGQSLVAGQGTFSASLNSPGTQSITASAGGLVGSQTGITVSGVPATASFLQQDTTTQGSWIGTYGAQGYDIVSGPTSLPASDTVTPKGQSTYTWTTTSTDPRALQVPGTTNRVAAVWYSATSFTVDVNLTDGQTHDLELYFLDWDNKGRGEQVQLSDAGTGKVLATETISSFSNGVYLDWKVSGNLLITITRQAGANAVLNGLFLDSTTTPTSTATASFLQQDTTKQGSWIGTYGAQGYDIVSGPTSLPANDTVTPSGESTYTWTTTSSDPRALQVPGSTNRIAAVWYSATSFTVDVNLADGQTHDLELYFVDWDSKGRSEQVQLSDAGTGKVLATETISSFTNGVYLNWKVSGNVLITITRTAGANAVLNGVFLDSTSSPTPTATASFLGQDTTTQGSWIGSYGAQGYDIVSGPSSLPSHDTVTPSGESTYTWTTTSSDPRALQIPGSTNRVAAVWYSATSFTVDVNLADGQTHDLELYFLDWDNKGRSEQVQLSDAATGKVLATETISSFTSGVYLDWKVSGNLLITITRTAGANAVLNGVFLDSTSVGVASYEVSAASRVNIGSLPVPVTNGAPIARESSGGFAIGSAGGTVDTVLGALAADDDAPAPGWSAHDLALGQVSREGRSRGSDRFSTRFKSAQP